ncbi:MAG TPA: PadR family transcriptional regulator [Solirubrobacteraceae bacterium]|nr:PadR family transcriptional regulator [Solirubrobacteraceae bacterium]
MKTQAIKLTTTSYAVLGLIDFIGPASPYDLKRAIEQTLSHFWPVPHTTFYAEPARLAAGGFLSEEQEAGGRRRKTYALTAAGRDALAEWVAAPTAQPPQVRDEAVLKIFCGADPEPLLGERVEWLRAELEELEGYLDAVRAAGGPAGVERSLLVGTAYTRAMIDEVFGQPLRAASTSRVDGRSSAAKRSVRAAR